MQEFLFFQSGRWFVLQVPGDKHPTWEFPLPENKRHSSIIHSVCNSRKTDDKTVYCPDGYCLKCGDKVPEGYSKIIRFKIATKDYKS